jgi:sec-independent protein translocase protein TatA
MFDVGGGELILIIIAGLLLFGPKKIPEVAQMVSKGMRKVKEAQSMLNDQMNEIKNEVNSSVQDPPKAKPSAPHENANYHPPTQIIDARRDQQITTTDPNSVTSKIEENLENDVLDAQLVDSQLVESQLDDTQIKETDLEENSLDDLNIDGDVNLVENPKHKDNAK